MSIQKINSDKYLWVLVYESQDKTTSFGLFPTPMSVNEIIEQKDNIKKQYGTKTELGIESVLVSMSQLLKLDYGICFT